MYIIAKQGSDLYKIPIGRLFVLYLDMKSKFMFRIHTVLWVEKYAANFSIVFSLLKNK